MGKGTPINQLSVAQLDKLLMILAKLVGIKDENLPDKESSLLIIHSLNRVYGNIKDEELKTAFELVASGQIECEEHFQSYSFKYVSSVINSYVKQINQFYKYIKPKEMKQEEAPTDIDWSSTLDFLIQETVKGNSPIIPTIMYDWMCKNNILVLSIEDKKIAMKYGERIYRSQLEARWRERPNKLDREEIRELDAGIKKDTPIYEKVVNEAKRFIIKEYVDDKAKEIKKHS